MINRILNKFNQFGISSHFLPNAIGLWPEEQATLVEFALKSDPDHNWVEIGSFCGGSAVLLCLARREMSGKGHVISVDVDFNPIFDHNVYNRGRFQDIHAKLPINSCDLGKFLYDPVSFAFIDGFHSFAQIVRDFKELLPRLTPDANILFHDVSPHIKDVVGSQIKYYDYATTYEDFFVDEAIAYICQEYGYRLVDIDVPEYKPHFAETQLTAWKHGTTSPFHAIGAIKKI